MSDQLIDLPSGYTLVKADMSDFPMPPDHPPVTLIASETPPIVLAISST